LDKIIIIGGSAGSFKLVSKLLNSLEPDFRHTIVLCLHRLKNARTGFLEALSINCKISLKEPKDKDHILSATIYLCPANYHLLFEYGSQFSLSSLDPVNHSRPSIDLCMDSAAEVFHDKVTGVILSGANNDGAKGLLKIKEMGGVCLIQSPANSEVKTMPQAALELQKPDFVLDGDNIITFIQNL
jgi:two-component system chemotaxis response regulator CheB